MIPTVRQWCEQFTKRALITQTWSLFLDRFPGTGCAPAAYDEVLRAYDDALRYGLTSGQQYPIRIPKPPLRSISYIKYYDTSGALSTWPSNKYEVSPPIAGTPVFEPQCQPYVVRPIYGEAYPGIQARKGAVEIQFICGYGAASSTIPAALRSAMLLYLSELFERREDGIVGSMVSEAPITSQRLAWPFRVDLFAEAA